MKPFALSLAGLLISPTGLFATEAISSGRPPVATTAARSPAEELPPDIRHLTSFGERADWSQDGKRILFLGKTYGDVFERVLQVSMSEHAENWANSQNSGLVRSILEIPFGLSGRQFAQHGTFGGRGVQQRMGAQQYDGIGQQRQAPRKPQTVEKHLPQSELVFLIRLLGGLNPRADLLQQSLGSLRAEWQESEQGFVRGRCLGKLARTVAGLPATRTQFHRRRDTKPMQVITRFIAEPIQSLSLRAGRLGFAHKGRDQFHVRAQVRHDGHAPAFPTHPFALGRQIAHVGDHLPGPPRPAPVAVMETGHEQPAFGNIGRRDPTDQRHQQYRWRIFPPPQTKAVLLVTDKPAALTGFEGASAQRSAAGGVSGGVFFLKPLQAAGKSVASIRAVAFDQSAAVWISGWRIASLICRNPMTPTRSRKALRMRTSGVRWRWRKRAKSRHPRCSGNNWVNRLSECTGVNSGSRCTRQSWAALNCQRGPRTGRAFQWALMKSSGMKGSSRSSNWLEPVTGRRFMGSRLPFWERCVRLLLPITIVRLINLKNSWLCRNL